MKKLIWIPIGLLICVFAWYKLSLRAPGKGTEEIVTIEKGTSVSGIASKLYEAKQIRSPRAFKVYTRLHGVQGLLKAGAYSLDGSLGVADLVSMLSEGKNAELKLTIPEGFTVKDIDALVAEAGLAPAGAIIDCASSCDFSDFDFVPSSPSLARRGGRVEGYLFPDTYFVNPLGFTPQSFLERLLTTFRSRVVTAQSEAIKASGHSLHEVITMASFVEEEAKGKEERGMVAGILWSRIEQGIGLYVDATNRYIADKPSNTLTSADLNMDSPYNTRLYRDLPPGPIASPSLQSIEATLHPTPSEYLYYLHGSDGVIRYAETNDEHNANKAKYLR